MIDKNKLIEVKNRDNGRVGYTIPDLGNLHRTFQPQETKEIPFEELKKLSYLPGGNTILQNYLVINDEEVVKSLLGEVEPEYNYTEKRNWISFNTRNTRPINGCFRFCSSWSNWFNKRYVCKIRVSRYT